MGVLLIALLALTVQDIDRFPTPALKRIEVDSDVVWFLTDPGEDSTSLAYGFVRSRSEWLRVTRTPTRPPSWPGKPGDRIALAPGFDLVLVPDSEGSRPGVWSQKENRIYLLRPDMTSADRQRLRPTDGVWYGIESDSKIEDLPIAGFSGAWARAGDAIWLGLAGGFSEGFGGLGGLLRFDLKTGNAESVWYDDLLQASVSGLAAAGDGLWIGTLHRGEYGPGGWIGLLGYDPESHGWTRYHTENSPLPDDLIWSVAADGDRLWISTGGGIAALNTRTREWEVRSFQLALAGDTMVHELVEGQRAADPLREGIFRLMTVLEVQRRRAFLEACLALPGERFAPYLRGETGGAVAALAHPSLAPFLDEALARPGLAGWLAADALQTLRLARSSPPLVQLTPLDSLPPAQAAKLAVSMGRLGDSSGYSWVRAKLREPVPRSEMVDVIRAAGELRDQESALYLFRFLRTRQLGREAFLALAKIGTVDVWRRLARVSATSPELRSQFLMNWKQPTAPSKDLVFMGAVLALARRALDSSEIHVRTEAARLLVDRRDPTGIPYLIAGLTYDDSSYRVGMVALIRATGVDSAPGPEFYSSRGVREQQFWNAWWAATQRSFRFAPLEAGLRAVRRWLTGPNRPD